MINSGSQWKRWEPHIHAPGTVLNNQFGGPSAWEKYIQELENSSPKIEAIAVTDYYVLDTYKTVLEYKSKGRLNDINLIFPNIELRLDVAAKSGFVNIHFLISPEDPEHIEQLERVLSRLHFQAFGDQFDCTKGDLIRLGKKADPSIKDDKAALSHGATQFKVNFSKLKEVYAQSDWARNNILIAVAGGAGDGTSGIRQAADATIRQEIEKFAHIIFASSVAQREFWLGQRSVSMEELLVRYGGRKPCLHGSDAHNLDSVGQPEQERYSWVKGGLEFDSLRQACINPEGRAYVGKEPPPSALPSQVISRIEVKRAPWITTPIIPLNSGLVTIIGARGSGKTALADIIATGCDSSAQSQRSEYTHPSFLQRAKAFLGESEVEVTWAGTDKVQRSLENSETDSYCYPRVRYLSQQFVEDLCSANGMSDGLLEEIERVILESHSIDERDGALSFAEFREQHTDRYQQAREREQENISDLSERIAREIEKEKSISSLISQISQKKKLVENYKRDLTKLVVKGTESQAKYYGMVSDAAQQVRDRIKLLKNQLRTFKAMQDEVISTRSSKAPEILRQAKERHYLSGLDDSQWDEFLLIYRGDVDNSLNDYIRHAEEQISSLSGAPLSEKVTDEPLVTEKDNLSKLPLSILVAEMNRLEKLFSTDKLIQNQYAAITKKIEQENAALKILEEKHEDAIGSALRRKNLQSERDSSYERLFAALINEQNTLASLYAPLMQKLAGKSDTLGKLGFYVRRVVDIDSWGSFAEEELLDRRKSGPFNGKGALIKCAKEKLQKPWESGTETEIKDALSEFISEYLQDMLSHAPYSKDQQQKHREWLTNFADWLFSTSHISIQYEVLYDGIDIRKLSPGTRGIVLLLLYLALDENDDRPLIIDQPEENLDPKSVNDELVPLFIKAKSKRQVIMVTHNANLVVNTDADQIIIAEVGPHLADGLPPIKYKAGGLENSEIRTAVRGILEGGETAFKERARRLRVKLER